jgi:hypothetical protein
VTVRFAAATVPNVAVTVVAPARVSVHAPAPAHPPPDHPVRTDVESGAGTSVITVPPSNAAAHVAPHAIPDGVEVTVPLPDPAFITVSVAGFAVNVAVTLFTEFMVTEHVPVPVHAPAHPAKVNPGSLVAVSVSGVPASKDAAQLPPQSMPAGLDVTVPPPVRVTIARKETRVNVAVTPFAESIVTEHVPVPEHAPVHPANAELWSDAAIRVTRVPWA